VSKLRTDDLTRIIREHPRAGSTELCARLNGISRATLTRALKTLGDALIIGGESRRTRYALRRPLRGIATSLPLYRVNEHGQGHEVGQLSLVDPEGSHLSFQETLSWPLDRDMSDGWFYSLPYALIDMRPQGFLGRNFAHARALDLGVSDNPDDWSDDDIAYVLATTGYDQPGDLILGEVAYRRFLDYRRTAEDRFLAESAVEASYLESAEGATRHSDAGSSAGGEFPKFTTSRHLNGKKVDVIVKFSGADESPAVRRWSNLLVCEHLASLTMPRKLQVPSADSAIYRYGGRTFLEVVRFDRHGDCGRSPVCTLSSFNAALIGTAGGPWPKTVRMLQAAGWISETDTNNVALIWWFGKLIGNSDMHDGNLAFRPGLTLAPAYDMLPMAYAPMRGGELPNRKFSPDPPLPAEAPIWRQAAEAAVYFWNICAEDTRIGADFRQICDDNGRNLATLISRMQ
jgi:HipA-like C-terminal domain